MGPPSHVIFLRIAMICLGKVEKIVLNPCNMYQDGSWPSIILYIPLSVGCDVMDLPSISFVDFTLFSLSCICTDACLILLKLFIQCALCHLQSIVPCHRPAFISIPTPSNPWISASFSVSIRYNGPLPCRACLFAAHKKTPELHVPSHRPGSWANGLDSYLLASRTRFQSP